MCDCAAIPPKGPAQGSRDQSRRSTQWTASEREQGTIKGARERSSHLIHTGSRLMRNHFLDVTPTDRLRGRAGGG